MRGQVGRIKHSTRFAAIAAAMPRGGALPDPVWRGRHRAILWLLRAHVVALALIGVAVREPLLSYVLSVSTVGVVTLAASWTRLSQATRALMATLGLLASSAVLINFFDGLIEAHFHFFVTIAVISLYQSWRPYLFAVIYVLAHHLILGTVLPDRVYNHAAAHHHPWLFAFVHGGAILAESLACLAFWRVTEDALEAERATHEDLAQANVELNRANVAVADLVAMLSHDLRVPLTVLIGYSEMALESWSQMSKSEQMDFVGKVNGVGHNLRTMLEDTLAVSTIDGEGVDPRPVPIRIDEAVRETLASLPEPRPEVDVAGLVPLTVMVDHGHLAQVLTNLLTNAMKYGGGRLAISSAPDEDVVLVRISDSGPGVPDEFVPDLFDRFSRSEEARAGRQKGTGLGLYISKSLMEANEADISYEPTPGGGATFVLRLPRAVRPAALLSH